jgi:hypothetical protein
MIDRRLQVPSGFEWRADTDRWRWIILGALGVAGCAGDAAEHLQGASAGSSSIPLSGAGGDDGTAQAETTAAPCEAPLTDLGGGWEQCSNGIIHRLEIGSCTSKLPRAEATKNPTFGGLDASYLGPCNYDTDCVEQPYGHCEWSPYETATYCDYGCLTNADCPAGTACVCGDPIGTCRAATCATDGDCGSGLLCSNFIVDPGCGGMAFACQTPLDACAAPSDCALYEYCVRGAYGDEDLEGPSYCSSAQCAVGRPFLVAGSERLASPRSRDDWYSADIGRSVPATLEPALRDLIHRGWLEQALMEHASVAAFARLSLQLLALGAPAELCSQAASAMQDEIEHARACFGLAGRFCDTDVGPGPLDLAGALEATDLTAVVLGTIAEGCIGETVAAIEAAEALAHCEDEAALPTLARIARDETRHAVLAWQLVAWALDVGPASLRREARTAFANAIGMDPAPVAPSALDVELARHGLLTPSSRVELRRRLLRDVIAPCARALLDAPAGDPRPAQRGFCVEA